MEISVPAPAESLARGKLISSPGRIRAPRKLERRIPPLIEVADRLFAFPLNLRDHATEDYFGDSTCGLSTCFHTECRIASRVVSVK